jgi:hypothetical protein
MAARLTVPLLCAVLLMAAGVAMTLLPVKVADHACHGNAVAVITGPETSTAHSRKCRDTARNDLLFGAGVAGVGLGLGAFAASLLRR